MGLGCTFFLVLERSVICPFGEYLGRSKIKGLSSCEYSNYSQYSLFLKEKEGKENYHTYFLTGLLAISRATELPICPCHCWLPTMYLGNWPFTVRNSSDLRYS